MKYLVSLASKYISRQKFRTLLTFISIMLASFILCISIFIVNSILASVKQYAKESVGTWELDLSSNISSVENSESVINKLDKHVLVEDLYYHVESNVSMPSEAEIGEKSYIRITCDKNVEWCVNRIEQNLTLGNPELNNKEQRIASRIESKNNIILSERYQKAGYKTGDTIRLTFTPVIGDMEGVSYTDIYTIQGFDIEISKNVFSMELFWENDVLEKLTNDNETIFGSYFPMRTALIRINKNEDFEKSVDTILENVGFNCKYLDVYEQFNNTYLLLELKALVEPGDFIILASGMITLIFVMWLIARFIIDNAFEISVAERNRKFTILKTLGASKGQLATLTLSEAAFYCFTSVPLGVIISYFIINFLFTSFKKSGVPVAVFSVHPIAIISGILFCFLGVIISSYTSAMWSTRKLSLVNAMNYGNNVKKSKVHKVKIGNKKLYKSPSRFIWTYTKRNISRTKGKFIFSAFAGSVGVIMLVSLVMSFIVLSKTNTIQQITEDMNEDQTDFIIYISDATPAELMDTFKNNENFSSVRLTSSSYYTNEDSKLISNFVESFILKESEDTYRKIMDFKSEENVNVHIEAVSEKEYNDNYSNITGISYEEFTSSGKAFALKEYFNTKDQYEKFDKDEVLKFSDKELKISGIISKNNNNINSGRREVILISADYYKNSVFYSTYVRFTLKDVKCYEEGRKAINEFVYANPRVNFTEDMFMFGTGMKSFLKVIMETIIIFLIFIWVTSIISMINLTNTRIMNAQREYFIFRCTGMTKKLLIRSVLLEVVIFSVVSTIIGVLLGIGVFSVIFYENTAEYIGIAIIPALFIALISLIFNILIPALFAIPWIKRLFTTSSDIVNSNESR